METSAVQQSDQSQSRQAEETVQQLLGNEQPSDDNYVELKYRSLENFKSAGLANQVGFFSIGLGLAEVLMPAQLGELAGVSRSHRAFLPVLGAREIAHGLGILASAKPTTAVQSRIAGDAVDLAFLGVSFASKGSNRKRLLGATIAVLGVAALDLICARRLSKENWRKAQGNPKAPSTVGQPHGRRAFSA
ncbi:MAG: hypothetical protein JO314_04525 [Acidobacteria bacterium]|nr:hypothetical protein [Acidobacteriota bacterium]